MKQTARLKGNQINWNQVFYFSEVAASGSLKDAATKLELSPSTLSEHVAQLEKDLEVQLFYRHHRKLSLTPEGNRLYLRAKEMFEAGQRLIDVVSPIPLGCYPVSIGLVPSPSLNVAYSVVSEFVREFGPMSMKLFHSKHSSLEAGLSKAEYDFGFSDRLPERKDIAHHRIASSSIHFYVSRKHAESSFSELLEKLPILICNPEPSTRTHVELALLEADLSPSSVITSDYPSAILDLCEQGLGIGVFSEKGALSQSSHRLHALRPPRGAPKLQDEHFVLWSKEAENSEAIRHLKQVLSKEVEFGTA